MQQPEQQPLSLENLASDLSDQQKAEFFCNLNAAGIGPHDMELVRLLHALQLYKAYYQSIPETVKTIAADIDRISKETRRCLDDAMRLGGQVVVESAQFRQEVAKIREHIETALRQSADTLVGQAAESLQKAVENHMILPLQNRIMDLEASSQAFAEVISQNKGAVEILRQNASLARRIHIGVYALCSLWIICFLSMSSWFYLQRKYEEQYEKERNAVVAQIDQNRAVLLELAKSGRTLELIRDPEKPQRVLLVMRDASAYQAQGKYGVIEFTK